MGRGSRSDPSPRGRQALKRRADRDKLEPDEPGLENEPPLELEELELGPPPEELNEQDEALDDELNEGVLAVRLFASRELGGLSDMWIPLPQGDATCVPADFMSPCGPD